MRQLSSISHALNSDQSIMIFILNRIICMELQPERQILIPEDFYLFRFSLLHSALHNTLAKSHLTKKIYI